MYTFRNNNILYSMSFPNRKGLIDIIAQLTTHQPDALEKELGRFIHRNTTLANACFQLFLQVSGIALSEVVLKSTPGGGRGGRVTLTFYEAGLGNKRYATDFILKILYHAFIWASIAIHF